MMDAQLQDISPELANELESVLTRDDADDLAALVLLAKKGICLDRLAKSQHRDVRQQVAKICNNETSELLKSDTDAWIRYELASRGFFLDTFVHDPDEWVRRSVALQGYCLETLVNDDNEMVRAAVAIKGYGLDQLFNDSSINVRIEVSKVDNNVSHLNALATDFISDIRNTAKQRLPKAMALEEMKALNSLINSKEATDQPESSDALKNLGI